MTVLITDISAPSQSGDIGAMLWLHERRWEVSFGQWKNQVAVAQTALQLLPSALQSITQDQVTEAYDAFRALMQMLHGEEQTTALTRMFIRDRYLRAHGVIVDAVHKVVEEAFAKCGMEKGDWNGMDLDYRHLEVNECADVSFPHRQQHVH